MKQDSGKMYNLGHSNTLISNGDKLAGNRNNLVSKVTSKFATNRYDEEGTIDYDNRTVSKNSNKIPSLKNSLTKRIKVLNKQATENPSLLRAITNKSLVTIKMKGEDFSQITLDDDKEDRRFCYKNKYLSSSYHLVNHKRNRADSFEIVPSSVPSQHNHKPLVAFYKLKRREIHPKVEPIKSENFCNLNEYGNVLFQKHVACPDLSKMTARVSDQFLTNTVYCQNDYSANKEYGMSKLNLGNISFQNQMNRNRSMEVNLYFADSKISK